MSPKFGYPDSYGDEMTLEHRALYDFLAGGADVEILYKADVSRSLHGMSPRVIHNLWTMLECLQKTNKTLTEQNASDQNQLRALEAEIKRLKKRVAALDVESAQLLEIGERDAENAIYNHHGSRTRGAEDSGSSHDRVPLHPNEGQRVTLGGFATAGLGGLGVGLVVENLLGKSE